VEACTHELGHSLGLTHDGDATSTYYAGTTVWAPNMGYNYVAAVTQFSKGDYPGANNLEDDYAVSLAGTSCIITTRCRVTMQHGARG
jgi:hypothetical protein